MVRFLQSPDQGIHVGDGIVEIVVDHYFVKTVGESHLILSLAKSSLNSLLRIGPSGSKTGSKCRHVGGHYKD